MTMREMRNMAVLMVLAEIQAEGKHLSDFSPEEIKTKAEAVAENLKLVFKVTQ